jgi:hypothetical protein
VGRLGGGMAMVDVLLTMWENGMLGVIYKDSGDSRTGIWQGHCIKIWYSAMGLNGCRVLSPMSSY